MFSLLQLPQTPEEWLAIEGECRKKFPRCIGNLDSKHIVVKCHYIAATSIATTKVHIALY